MAKSGPPYPAIGDDRNFSRSDDVILFISLFVSMQGSCHQHSGVLPRTPNNKVKPTDGKITYKS